MQYEEIVALFPDFLDENLSATDRKIVIDALDSSIELQQALTQYKLKQEISHYQTPGVLANN